MINSHYLQNNNSRDNKRHNQFQIMSLVASHTEVNRSYLAMKTNLTRAAITKIVANLIEEKFIAEEHYHSISRNRKARYLKIKSEVNCIIAIQLGRNNIIFSIVDISGNILHRKEDIPVYSVNSHESSNRERFMKNIKEHCIQKIPPNMSCLGCVVITPGISLKHEYFMHNGVSYAPFYWDIDIYKELIENKFNIATFIENDSTSALLGEKWYGKGKNCENIVLYNIGKGMGSSVYLNNKIVKTITKNNIDIGHITIKINGRKCPCGNTGCLELYASSDALKRKIEKLNNNESCRTIEDIFMSLKNGALDSPKIHKILLKHFRLNAEGIVTLVSIFSPEKIIIITNDAPFYYMPPFIKTFKQTISTRVYSNYKKNTIVEESQLRDDAFLLGSIPVVLENYFLSK